MKSAICGFWTEASTEALESKLKERSESIHMGRNSGDSIFLETNERRNGDAGAVPAFFWE